MSRVSDASEAKAARQQLRESAASVQENLREMGGQVRDAAAEKYNQLKEQAGQYYEEGRQRAIDWERGLENYVQEKPIKSLLIAAGVGMLIGILWKRS